MRKSTPENKNTTVRTKIITPPPSTNNHHHLYIRKTTNYKTKSPSENQNHHDLLDLCHITEHLQVPTVLTMSYTIYAYIHNTSNASQANFILLLWRSSRFTGMRRAGETGECVETTDLVLGWRKRSRWVWRRGDKGERRELGCGER